LVFSLSGGAVGIWSFDAMFCATGLGLSGGGAGDGATAAESAEAATWASSRERWDMMAIAIEATAKAPPAMAAQRAGDRSSVGSVGGAHESDKE
jgi:hypothetical protein